MEILKDLIEINTIGDLENERFRNYIKTFLSPLGFTFREIGEGKEKVLIVKRGDGDLGFVCHTDTVGDSSLWTKEPLTLTVSNDKLYGLGVSDMKGGIAALLESIKELDKSISLTCYFTYDEETNFRGINELVKLENDFPSTLIFTEPTDNVPVIANKGCLEFKVSFSGKSAHSSTPMLGENAIFKAIEFIKELEKLEKELMENKVDIYEIPYTTFNLSKISGGTVINKVPDYCEIYFDFRTVSRNDEEIIFNRLNNLVVSFNASMEIINNVSSAMNESTEFRKKIEGICNKPSTGLNYVTEASFFNNKNILILGPGPVTAHQEDEFISIDSYKKSIELYKNIIINLTK